MEEKITKAAVGVIIFKNDKVLLIRRQESVGAGDYAFPGGKLEFMESFESCVSREVLEETNISIKNITFLNVSNTTFFGQHYILLGFKADWEDGEAKIMEPEKCDYIGWHDINDLPQPFFEPSRVILEGYKANKNYYDKE
jgi:8-oxo-dGTP diphosphatase